MLAGSPRRLLRLSDAGAAILDRIGSGEALEGTPARAELVDRLEDAGVLHPDPAHQEGSPGSCDVTLVVPVRDRADGLKSLLESILGAVEVPAAIIVVDDGSVDPDAVRSAVTAARAATATAATSTAATPTIDIARHERPRGPAAARNTGLDLVTTLLVAMVDSDCAVAPDWLSPLLALFADPQVAVAAPRVRSMHRCGTGAGIPGLLARYEAMRSPLDLGRRRARVAPSTSIAYVPSAAILARTASLTEAGGFDEAMPTGEDVDLIWRLVGDGHRVRYEPSSSVEHAPRAALRAWLAQRFGYGRSAAALERRHPGSVSPVVIGRWSAAVWGLATVGAWVPSFILVAATTTGVVRSMPDVPPRVAIGVALGGYLAAGRQLALAMVREWWPITVALSMFNPRARRLLAVSSVVSVVHAWRAGSDRVNPEIIAPAFAVLAVLDDVAYCAGVWIGCLEQRSVGALLPRG